MVNVLYFVHHDAHGIAKHVVHVGFQLHALHVSHALRVFAIGAGLHCRVGGIRVRRVVNHAVHRRVDFNHGNHGLRYVRPNFHELVGFGHDADQVRVIYDFNAGQARNFAFGFLVHERKERQRVGIRPPNVGVIHHDHVRIQVFHVRRERGCRGHHNAGMPALVRAFFGHKSDYFGVVVHDQFIHHKPIMFQNGHRLRRGDVVFERVRFAGNREGGATRVNAVLYQLYHDFQIGH